MPRERYYWQVCFERDGVWDCIGTHETRADAEENLRRVKSRAFPDAFLVRETLTRMDQAPTTTTLTAV